MKIKSVYIFYILLFVLIGFVTLNFNYIEGDDAKTILYHTLGRDKTFQPPYSPYHSMFDVLMSFINTTNETILKKTAISLSFLFSLLSLLLIVRLLSEKFYEKKKQIAFALFLVPFILPDIIFNSLIINPAIISFAIILLSHVLLLQYTKKSKLIYLVLSIVLFGFGVSFRWNNGFYLFVLFGYFILNDANKFKELINIQRLKKSVIIFPFYIVSVILFIQVSGYSIREIFQVFSSGASYLDNQESSMLSIAASAIPFLTPAFLLLFLFGTIHCIKKKIYMPLALLFLSILPYLSLGTLVPFYKYLICIILPLFIIVLYGYLSITNKNMKRVVVLLVILPWFFGFQIKSNSVWGPGFELKTNSISNSNVNNFNPDKSIKIGNVKLVLGSGMAMPTPEGPRPLYGFGKVVLKDWKHFVETNNFEREAAVNYAIENNCNILQDVNHSFIATKLCEFNFITNDSIKASNDFGLHRRFSHHEEQIIIDVFKNKKELFDKQLMKLYLDRNSKVVVYSSYTNIIAKLKKMYPNQFEQKGSYWGILMMN